MPRPKSWFRRALDGALARLRLRTRPTGVAVKLPRWPTKVKLTAWDIPSSARSTWIALLILADRDGHVPHREARIAEAASVTLDECRRALCELAELGTIDPHADAGWVVRNFRHYQGRQAAQAQA